MTDWKKIRAEFPAVQGWTVLNAATFGLLPPSANVATRALHVVPAPPTASDCSRPG